jgi:hypothetical protein
MTPGPPLSCSRERGVGTWKSLRDHCIACQTISVIPMARIRMRFLRATSARIRLHCWHAEATTPAPASWACLSSFQLSATFGVLLLSGNDGRNQGGLVRHARSCSLVPASVSLARLAFHPCTDSSNSSAMSSVRMRILFWRAAPSSVRLHCWQAVMMNPAPVSWA